MFLRNNAN